jgi:hypothetical protein
MDEVVNAYRDARSTARRRVTLLLLWQEWRARGQAQDRTLDQCGLARLTALQAELRARGLEVQPIARRPRDLPPSRRALQLAGRRDRIGGGA